MSSCADKHHVRKPFKSFQNFLPMAREGTRSTTGSSKPRVFMQVDTAPAIKRTNRPKKRTTKTTTTSTGKKPTGVTKKRSSTKKTGVAGKVS
jgi:hypothetical protein